MNKTVRIIPRTAQPDHADWQRALAQAVTDPAELLDQLQLPPELAADAAARDFSLKVPQDYIRRMRPGDPNDPLLRQVLPVAAEIDAIPGYSADPVGELDQMPVPGLLHKYPGRVLLTVTGACGVHCRYCFRRHFPYSDANPARAEWQDALDYIRGREDIREVILSGGDPLVLSDDRLLDLLARIEAIPHLSRLRLHSRLPVVLPGRLTSTLTDRLIESRLATTLVLHINHPQELDNTLHEALEPLRQSCVTLLNQAVLLRHINDDADTLRSLSERLFEYGILPYYLHALDPVAGAAHFDVSETLGSSLIQTLRDQLPGYLVPTLVREIPGRASKTPL